MTGKMKRKSIMRVFFPCYLVFWVLMSALLPTTTAGASSVELTAAERDYLNSKGSITFISQTSYPPFEFVDERFERTERRGMMIELAQWISSEFGFHARFIDDGFADAQAAVLDGTADVLTSFFYSDKRDRMFDFTQTIFPVPASIFVISNRTDINSIDDLRGKRIAMQHGDYANDFLHDRSIPFTLIATDNFSEATTRVISGVADAVIGDEQIVLYYLYSNNLENLVKIVGEPLYTGLNSMAVKEDNRLLQSILNKGINHARASGMLERLNRKWIGTPLPSLDNRPDLLALWPYLAGIVILLLAVSVWNLLLRRTVAARTAALRRNEQRLAAVIEGTRAGAWEWNLTTDECFYNDRWAQMLGYELAELEPLTHNLWRQFVHPEDLPRAEELIKSHCRGEIDDYRCEIRMRHKDGHWVWILDRGSICERDNDGLPLVMAGTHMDISARKQRDTELYLKSLVLDQISDMVTVTDTNGVITYVNLAAARMLERQPSEVVGRQPRDVYANPLEKGEEILGHTLADGAWRGEVINRTADGRKQLVDLRTRTIIGDDGKVIALCGIATDITQWRASQLAVAESENKYRQLFEESTDAIYVHDLDGRIIDVNLTATRQSGYSRDELLAMKVFDLHADKSVCDALFTNNWHAWMSGDSYLFETRHQHKDGSVFDVEVRTGKVEIDGNSLIQGVVQDVTQRKRAEKMLADQAESRQALLDNIRTQVWYLIGEHQYGQVNQAHADFFGVSKDDLAYKDLHDVMSAEAVAICRHSNSLVFSTGESTLTEELVTDGSGNTRLLQIHKAPRLDADGRVEYVVCSAEDITDRKAAELALQQKHDEMEQFVYIVSHDLKSPLITIKTFLKMLQDDISNGDQEQIAVNLEYINGATTKIETLLGALLQLSRVGNTRNLPQQVMTSTLISDCLSALAGPLHHRQVKVVVDELPATLHGDPLHFGQIWQNLIENAVKYMGDQAEPQIDIGCIRQGSQPVFYVRDNGMGIAAEHHQHIFGIFTQLSRSSEGAGLGLALVKKIVETYQGDIRVESDGEGHGSCFKFTLPTAL